MKVKYYFLIILMFMIPTIVGYLTNTDMHFSGLTHTTDGNNYLNLMLQAQDGHFLMTNMYTHEDVPYLNIRPTFYFAGKFAQLFNLPNIFVYHLFRILGIVLVIYYLEKLLSLFFRDGYKRSITLVICIFGSGIGWFFKTLALFGIKLYGSIDQWITDANNFLTMMGHAHSIFSLAFMIAASYHFIKWYKSNSSKQLLISGSFLFFLGFEHLFDVITLMITYGLLILEDLIRNKTINKIKLKQLTWFCIIISIPFIFTYVMFQNPTYGAWNDQNVLDTPPLHHVAFGYGLMFISFLGYITSIIYNKRFNKLSSKKKIILYWIVAVLILIYSPFNIQRRFLEGAHIPFGIITGLFLFDIIKNNLKKINWKFFITLILIFIIPTNIFHLANDTLLLEKNQTSKYKASTYIHQEEYNAILWLKQNYPDDSIIISNYNIGNHIVGNVNIKAYLGHWAQTINIYEKEKNVIDYFQKTNLNIVENNNTLIWYGLEEQSQYPNFLKENNLKLIFENEKIKIFKK